MPLEIHVWDFKIYLRYIGIFKQLEKLAKSSIIGYLLGRDPDLSYLQHELVDTLLRISLHKEINEIMNIVNDFQQFTKDTQDQVIKLRKDDVKPQNLVNSSELEDDKVRSRMVESKIEGKAFFSKFMMNSIGSININEKKKEIIGENLNSKLLLVQILNSPEKMAKINRAKQIYLFIRKHSKYRFWRILDKLKIIIKFQGFQNSLDSVSKLYKYYNYLFPARPYINNYNFIKIINKSMKRRNSEDDINKLIDNISEIHIEKKLDPYEKENVRSLLLNRIIMAIKFGNLNELRMLLNCENIKYLNEQELEKIQARETLLRLEYNEMKKMKEKEETDRKIKDMLKEKEQQEKENEQIKNSRRKFKKDN